MNKTRVWSPLQNTIFEHVVKGKENLVIQACAGSGKTSTVIEAILRYIKSGADKQLLMAFNVAVNKVAQMRLQRAGIVDKQCRTQSFNSFGYQILRKSFPTIQFDANKVDTAIQTICAPNQFEIKRELSKQKMERRDGSRARPLTIFHTYSHLRVIVNSVRSIGSILDDEQDDADLEDSYLQLVDNLKDDMVGTSIRGELSPSYLKLLAGLAKVVVEELDQDTSSCDYADQMRMVVLRNLITKRRIPKTLWVDECQDTNIYQLLMIEMCSKLGTRIIAVGDRRQSIYGFRGSTETSMDSLIQITDAVELPLSITYRCRSRITKYINDRIDGSSMVANTQGGRVRRVDTKSSFFEACDDDPELKALVVAQKGKEKESAELKAAKSRFLFDLRADVVQENGIQMVVSATNAALLRLFLILRKQKHNCHLNKTNIMEAIIKATVQYEKRYEWDEFSIELRDTLSDPPPQMSTRKYDMLKSISVVIEMLQPSSWSDLQFHLKKIESTSNKGTELHTVHSAKGLEAQKVYVLDTFFYSNQLINMEYVAMTRASELLITEFEPVPVHSASSPKLHVELIPEELHGHNLREVLTNAEWTMCKWYVKRESDSFCEVCGSRGNTWPVECHEQWEKTYVGLKSIDKNLPITKRLALAQKKHKIVTGKLKLVGLRALCPSCHQAVHFGHARVVGKEKEARAHLMKVNKWSEKEVDKHIEAAFTRYELDLGCDWKIDMTWILDFPHVELSPDTKKSIVKKSK